MPRSFRSLTISFLALWKKLSQKEVGKGAGLPQKKVSYYLREGNLEDDALFNRLLQGVRARPGEVQTVTVLLENLESIERDSELTPEEREAVEAAVLDFTRMVRGVFTEAVRISRELPPPDDYPGPGPGGLDATRWRAKAQWKLLEPLPEDEELAMVRADSDFWNWALVERVCEESVVQASRKVERAASLARLAQEIAGPVRGPEFWRSRVQGFATAHAANALRVAGELRQADTLMERAKQLWQAGADPEEVLDPGRLLDLEASLRRGQRRFEDALALLEEALEVGRCPERYLIIKGFTLEVMGEYDRAVEALLTAEPLVERQGDDRLIYMLRFNLAVNLSHLGLYVEASKLIQQVRDLAVDLGDEVFLIRVIWLEGRIAAGLGRVEEGRRLLEQARRAFALRRMDYDVALALLEEAVLLLEDGRIADVREVARGLAIVFESKGVHQVALAALRLFQEAVERDEATADLARSILSYLFRARYDQGLRFTLA
jgi:tetratricopeptide (TPR) repeat protein